MRYNTAKIKIIRYKTLINVEIFMLLKIYHT